MDEHRIGLKPITRGVWAPKGERPLALGHHRYEWLYVPSSVRHEERGNPKPSASLASRTSARDHANGARSSSGARRSRSVCEPSCWLSRRSCAEQYTTPSRKPGLG